MKKVIYWFYAILAGLFCVAIGVSVVAPEAAGSIGFTVGFIGTIGTLFVVLPYLAWVLVRKALGKGGKDKA